MYDEESLLPISALQHFSFCERQWALIHLEGVWDENKLTAEGRILHERTHAGGSESRGDIRIVRGLRLRSLRLGVAGQADVVEFHRLTDMSCPDSQTIVLARAAGRWRVVPVEYKRGSPKPEHCDEVQVCAQAICLEEMLGVIIPRGEIFYGSPRRRHEVEFSEDLRMRTESLAVRLHDLTRKGVTPPACFEKKCRNCSLLSICLPASTSGTKSVRRYLATAFREEPE